MIPDIYIWRSAQLMIRQYGDAAVRETDARASALTQRRDSAGGAVWRRIRQAIEQLQNRMPDGSVH